MSKAQVTGPIPDADIWITAPGKVVVVNFEGNKHLSSNELGTVVATQVTGVLSRILNSIPILSKLGSPYQTIDASTLSSDTARLDLYYRGHGFLLARAHYRVNPNVDDKEAYMDYLKKRRIYKGPPNHDQSDAPVLRDTVTFSIEEGPVFTINRVAFAGLENLPDEFQPELNENVTIKRGDQWSATLAAHEVDRLDSIMVESGYPFFKYDTIVVEHLEGQTGVNVSLYFTPGNRYRYGPIKIVYDTAAEEKRTIEDKVILAQMTTTEGDWYHLFDIQRSESNLYKLNAFDIARVTLDTSYISTLPESKRDSAEVPVEVFLRPRIRAEVAPGIYGGTGSQGFVAGASADYSNRNFTGLADNLTAQFSYQLLPTTQQRFSSNVDYVVPYIGLGRVPFITGLAYSFLKQDTVPNIHPYSQTIYSAHFGSQFILSKLDNKTSITPDVSFEYVTSITNDSLTSTFLTPAQFGIIPSVTYQDDRTNDVFNPSGGDFLGLTLEAGIPANLIKNVSSAQYFKSVPQVKYFYDLSDSGTSVLAGRLQIGKTWLFSPTDPATIPSAERRFYGGGASSLRGWSERSLLVSTDTLVHADFGGINTLIGSFEYRFAPFNGGDPFSSTAKLLAPLHLVLFYDIGNVWDNSATIFSQLAQDVGIGLRYSTLFGALRLDWGFKLYDPSGRFDLNTAAIHPGDQGKWLFSNLGHGFSGISTIHFAIGQAF